MVKKDKNKKIKRIFFKTRKKRDFNYLPLFFFLSAVLVLSFASYVLSQPYAPLDTGPALQEKQGPLKINTAGSVDDDGLIVGKGDLIVSEGKLSINGPLVLKPRASEPGTPAEGMVYYDKGPGDESGKLKYYDGREWKDLGGGRGMVAQVYRIGFGFCRDRNYITCYINTKDKTINCPCNESRPQYCQATAAGCAAHCTDASMFTELVNKANAPSISEINTVHTSIKSFSNPEFGFSYWSGEPYPPSKAGQAPFKRGLATFTNIRDSNTVQVIIEMYTKANIHFKGEVEVMVMGYE